MQEELGISVPIHEIVISHRESTVFSGVYKAVISRDTVFYIDPEEVECVEWSTLEVFETKIISNPELFVRPFLEIWDEFRDKLIV